ncbi:MAG: magnesium transporter [Candidatus Aenigmarchaeota archaeon]|nr:magnesium transporter [Candidatus Aenigmarchaeota archaeon]
MSYYTLKGILKDALPVLMFMSIFSMISGTFLDIGNQEIKAFAAILLVVPPFVNMGGDIASIVGARISSALHLGYTLSFRKGKPIFTNLTSAFIVGLISFAVLGLSAETILILLNGSGIGYIKFMEITTLAGLSVTMILSLLSIGIAYISKKYGIDPDDMTIPIVTTLGDIMGIGFLIFIASILL